MSIDLKEYDPGPFFDEMMAGKNRSRPLAKELIGLFRKMNDGELSKRQAAAELAIKAMGITFTVYSEDEGMIDRAWPFDIVPRILEKAEWDRVEAGLKQRPIAALFPRHGLRQRPRRHRALRRPRERRKR